MHEVIPFDEDENDYVAIQNLKPYVKLCCSNNTVLCTLCLMIHTEISIDLDRDLEDEEHSGSDEGTKGIKKRLFILYLFDHLNVYPLIVRVVPPCRQHLD